MKKPKRLGERLVFSARKMLDDLKAGKVKYSYAMKPDVVEKIAKGELVVLDRRVWQQVETLMKCVRRYCSWWKKHCATPNHDAKIYDAMCKARDAAHRALDDLMHSK